MILATQTVLVVGLFGLSLLSLMMVRQVGVLSRRLGEKLGKAGGTVLAPGTPCPLAEIAAVDDSETYRIPAASDPTTALLFISFSCPMCQGVLGALPALRDDQKKRLLVFLLDGNPMLGYGKEILELQRSSLRVVRGEEAAETFAIGRAPFVYVVDSEGKIKSGVGVMTPEDLIGVLDA